MPQTRRAAGSRAGRLREVVLASVSACGAGEAHGRATKPAACNGSAALCARRLDQVVFPGTHNSFAASAQPGWYFANQRYGIARQLGDGIRLLLLDVHFGVRDPSNGRVRTDLTAEGSDRNKAAKALSGEALSVADRIAGGVGLGTLKDTPEPFLCHTLCELGAEPLDQELEVIRRFLDEHAGQVLVLIVEDYVPPATINAAFERAGLIRYVATLDRSRPLPTLGTLVAQDRRLVVFAEAKGSQPAWYMPAFSYIQDTPLGAKHPGQLSCDRNRGQQDSPLLLINYWVPPFPPSPTLNATIGRSPFLRGRIERCLRERHFEGALVAVDFYERTSVVNVARELNKRGG